MVQEEELEEKAIAYNTKYETSTELYEGQTKVKQPGEEGKMLVHSRLFIHNGEVKEKEILSEEMIKKPVNEIIIRGTKEIPTKGSGDFYWPTDGGEITSHIGWRWGSYHKGIDIAGVESKDIFAADNGVVTFSGIRGGYGKRIVIDHQNGFETTYSHLSTLHVSEGQSVKKGQPIGFIGSTGSSTGIHLHFEMYFEERLQNPLDYY
nr:peptidoglycan DD-metalloendopeptidase family protein [Salirhabdus salicampi]